MRVLMAVLVAAVLCKPVFAQSEVVLDCMLKIRTIDNKWPLLRETVLVDREKRTIRLKGALYTIEGQFYKGYIRKIDYWGSDYIIWRKNKASGEGFDSWYLNRLDGRVGDGRCARVSAGKALF